jgi:short-subunit dehydrogenase
MSLESENPRLIGDLLDHLLTLFEHEPRCFKAQPLHGSRRRPAGFGAKCPAELARAQLGNLILVARNHARLNAFALTLADATGRAVEVIAADLTVPEDVARVQATLRQDASINLLVNNRDWCPSPLVDSDIWGDEKMIALNLTALTRLTYAAVPGFVARGNGTIINISSIFGIAPERLNSVYGATKAFVLAFSQSLDH